MGKKQAIIYKIVSGLTLVAPMAITLFISAIYSPPKPDLIVMFDTDVAVKEVADLEKFFGFGYNEHEKKIDISNNYFPDDRFYQYNTYNVRYYTPDLKVPKDITIINEHRISVKINEDNFVRFITSDFNEVVEFKNKIFPTPVSNFNLKTGTKVGVATFGTAIGVAIVSLVITGKLQLQKKYPKTAVFLGLLIGTVILALINTLIGDILRVFVVATISWALYCAENYYYKNIIVAPKNEIDTNSLLEKLVGIKDEHKQDTK